MIFFHFIAIKGRVSGRLFASMKTTRGIIHLLLLSWVTNYAHKTGDFSNIENVALVTLHVKFQAIIKT